MERDDRDGVTLVELLVVITLVGILAALLLPWLGNATAKAQPIRCIGNLHQHGVALQGFVADYAGYPSWMKPPDRSPLGLTWASQLERGGFGHSDSAGFHQDGVWRCPSAQPRDASDPNHGYNAFGVLGVGNLTNHFGLSGHLGDNPETFRPIGESEVVSPADMMAIGESDALAFMRNMRYDFWGGRLSHLDRANAVCCDGHVESPTREDLCENTGDEALARWNRDQLPHRERL